MIGLLDGPTNGSIFIDEINTTTLNDSQISSFRNKKLGFIFQFSNLLSDLTVLENILLPIQIAGTNSITEKDAIDLLKAVGLEDQMYKRANKISGGQAQRVAIARALINNPNIIFLDEPTGNLDTDNAKVIQDLLIEISKEHGIALVTATHDNNFIKSFNRIYKLDNTILREI